ncbi:MAG: hypothetical protein ACI4FV_03430 [Lachnospiraceae bacterium]
MDHTFQLRQNMNEEQLEEFAQNSLQKEMALEDYEKNNDQYMQMSAEQLRNLYRKDSVESRDTLPDLPKQREDEKDRKYKKRLQKKLDQEERRRQQEEMHREDRIMAEQEADQLLWEEQERRKPDFEQLRQTMGKDPRYSFIQSQHLCSVLQYQSIEEVKRILDEHLPKYEEHKTELDKMYEEYFHLTEVGASMQETLLTITEIQFDTGRVSTKMLVDVLQQRLESTMEKLRLIHSRTESIKAGIEHLLTGKELTPAQSLVVREYMTTQDELEQHRQQAEQQAGAYVHILKEKTGTYNALMGNIREGNAGPVMKPSVLEYLQSVKDFDTKDLEHCTDQELLTKNQQLQELYVLSKQFADAANGSDPEDEQGRSILDTFLESNQVSRDLFTLKCSVIQSFAEKARHLAMLQAYQKGVLSEDAFTEEELDAIRKQYDLMPEQKLSKTQLLSFVKERMALTEAARYGAYHRFFCSEEASRLYGGPGSAPVLRNMDEEELFRTRGVKIFSEDMGSEEYIRSYAENKERLLDYKGDMIRHYEDLELRFHHQIPSVTYILEHWQELIPLFASVQADAGLMENMQEQFDLTREENLRLYHLVQFYNGLGQYMEEIFGTSIRENGDLKKAEASLQGLIRQMQSSADYLGQERNAPNQQEIQNVRAEQREQGAQEEENQDITEQDIIKFRQLAEEAETIGEATPETQLTFVEKTLELKNYIRQYQGNSALVLKQLNGWYRFARKRVIFMTQTAGRPIYELLDGISNLSVTEEMLEPDYVRSHIEQLQASFRGMDEYQALLKQNPALKELLLSDEQRIRWNINRGLMERYRDYVNELVRNQQPQQEATEREKMQKHLSREKEGIQEVLGGFGGYAQKVDALIDQVRTLEPLNMSDGEEIVKSLRETGLWINDLSKYVKRPLVLSSENFFDASVMTMMSMFGHIEKNLRLAGEKLSQIPASEQAQSITDRIGQISEAFLLFKERVPGYAQDIRKDILNSDENISLTLQDVVMGVQSIKVFQVNDQTERTGAGASDVLILKDEDGTFFFKENETLLNFMDSIEEALPVLEDDELSEKLRDFLQKETDENGNPFQFGNIANMKYHLEQKENIPDQIRQLSMYNEEMDKISKAILRYLGEGDGKLEKWAEFANKFTKAHVTQEAASNPALDIQSGADMTARNYASERVAELLGLKGLIVRNREAAVVDENGNRKQGFVMDKAKGKSAKDVVTFAKNHGYQLLVNDEAQKNLLNLQILDIIMGQIDRHEENFFLDYVQDDEQRTITVHQVTGIDNDFSFGLSERLGGHNTGTVFEREKYYPGMIDIKMYESLMAISPELLAVNLEGVIEQEYLEPLKKRYEKVQNAIRDAKLEADQKGIDFFRTEEGWGQETQKVLGAKRDFFSTLYIYKMMVRYNGS